MFNPSIFVSLAADFLITHPAFVIIPPPPPSHHLSVILYYQTSAEAKLEAQLLQLKTFPPLPSEQQL